jgi:hypothetical protein
MLPAAVVVLDELPLTPSGKVNRRALPAPAADHTAAAAQYVEPRTPAERSLAAIWAELLHVERVGAEDNFFELGGESLLAVRMINQAREARLTLTPRDLFQHQTVGELAALAEAPSGRSGHVAGPHPLLVPMQPDGAAPPLFCVHPIEGTVTGYAALARLLGTGRPVYGLRAAGLEDGEEPAATVESMAERYLDAGREAGRAASPRRLVDGRAGRLRDVPPTARAGRAGCLPGRPRPGRSTLPGGAARGRGRAGRGTRPAGTALGAVIEGGDGRPTRRPAG